MPNGYAGRYDSASDSYHKLAFSPASVATTKAGAELDRQDFSPHQLQHLELVVNCTVALTGGAANDEIDVTIVVRDTATSGSGQAAFKTYSTSIVVDDNSTCEFVASVPVKLNAAERYIDCTVLVEAGTGAPTVSSATASATYHIKPNSIPVLAGEAGSGSAAYDKDGYVNATLTA